ncbi:hypothetical protein FNF29_01600 [Cafeteria roenbergensis]|uniref:Cation/H+ exchanger transmembrane domain-containing protein n=1 Tax=Cafeteria roenbergensis TaxID=33653 RepID=A0A5A8CRH7_CAFRO|nr:hypothetical protein FNF29_01600 [Cafeteria roenbergensis]|eukprot:KAA0155685.1 hypothetical protein FNF29_01600 [Cafeteria roenbergensis]
MPASAGSAEEWEEQISTVQRGLETLLRESTEDLNRANSTLQRTVAEDDDEEDEVDLPPPAGTTASAGAQGNSPSAGGPGVGVDRQSKDSRGGHHRPEVTVVKAEPEPTHPGSDGQLLSPDGAPAGTDGVAWGLDCAAAHPSARRLCPCGRMSALAEENKRLKESLAAEARERLEELTDLSKHVAEVLRGFASSRKELREKDLAIHEQEEEDEAMARAHAIMEALETVEYETGMVKLADGTAMLFHDAKQEAEDILLEVSERAKERAKERAAEAMQAEEDAHRAGDDKSAADSPPGDGAGDHEAADSGVPTETPADLPGAASEGTTPEDRDSAPSTPVSTPPSLDGEAEPDADATPDSSEPERPEGQPATNPDATSLPGPDATSAAGGNAGQEAGAAALIGAPPSFGYLLGGAIAGPSGLGLVSNLEQVGTVAQFGVVFPLFANGLQFHLKDHARFHKQAAISALVLSASLMGLFALLGITTGLVSGVTEGVLVGLAASVCSPGVAIANLVHLGHLTRTAGHIGTGIMAAQDLLMGLLLSLPHALAPYLQQQRKGEAAHHRFSAAGGHSHPMPSPAAGHGAGSSIGRSLAAAGAGAWQAATDATSAFGFASGPSGAHGRRLADASAASLHGSHSDAASHPSGADGSLALADNPSVSPVFLAAGALLKSAAAFVLVALLTALVSRRVVPSVVDFLGQRGQQRDVHLLALVGLCMVLGVATEAAGLSLEMGAFFAGLMVAGAKDIERVMKAVDPLAQVFSGMFFASIGLVISPSYVVAKAPVILSAIVVLFVVKTLLLFAVTRWLGFETRHAVVTAVALAQVSEYSLIFTGKAHAIGLLSRATYLRWMTATIGALVTSPLLARTAPLLLKALGRASLLAAMSHNARHGADPAEDGPGSPRHAHTDPVAAASATTQSWQAVAVLCRFSR